MLVSIKGHHLIILKYLITLIWLVLEYALFPGDGSIWAQTCNYCHSNMHIQAQTVIGRKKCFTNKLWKQRKITN